MVQKRKETIESIELDEEGGNENSFAKLALSISQLNNGKRVKPPTRNELGHLISEYHVKEKKKKGAVVANELANVLGGKSNLAKLNKKLKYSSAKTLAKPLAKPIAEKIKRQVGFEVARKQFEGWESIVESNRVAGHTIFPLNQPKFHVYDDNELFTKQGSNLVESTDDGSLANKKVEESFPYSLEEILEKRKEIASMRARQSYREAKAYRQSRIKSKKYRRIEKRKRIQQQIKEFEVMKKTDPEGALKKLDELERSRAEERATLKHKSTGKWAKSLAVRAKYDEESRKVLAEQLAISRDLTQKVRVEDSSEDEESEPTLLQTAMEIAENNPWSLEVTSELNKFISGFRSFSKSNSNGTQSVLSVETPVAVTTNIKMNDKPPKKAGKWTVTDASKKVAGGTQPVIYLPNKIIANQVSEKFKVLKGKVKSTPLVSLKRRKNVKADVTKKVKKDAKVITIRKNKNKIERPDLDVELDDSPDPTPLKSKSKELNSSEDIVKTINPAQINVDPKQFIQIKPRTLKTALPDDVSGGDDGLDDENQEQVIMEAFADDNVVDDFLKQKEDEEKTTKLEIKSELPGWGSWGGTGISKQTRRRKRFLQLPTLPNRKDKGLIDVIINEEGNPKIKNHMVKDVPFPFRSVAAFEASIRAPISREWIPETTHRDLIRPTVITKMGSIIEPISDSVLIRNQKSFKPAFQGKKKPEKTSR